MPTINYGLRVHVFFALLHRGRRCSLLTMDGVPVHGVYSKIKVKVALNTSTIFFRNDIAQK